MVNGKPPSGIYRMLLPSEADWTGKKEKDEEGKAAAAGPKKGRA